MYDGRYYQNQIDAIIAHRTARMGAEQAVCHLLQSLVGSLLPEEMEQITQILLNARRRIEQAAPALVAFSTLEDES